MSGFEPFSGRRLLALLLVLFLLAVGGGATLGLRIFGRQLPFPALDRTPRAPQTVDAGAAHGFSPGAWSLWSRFARLFGAEDARGFTFARLLGLLLGRADDPLARAFAAEFMEDPELRRIWDDYARGGRESDIYALLRRLFESKAFGRLLSRYAGDPRFRRLAEAFQGELVDALAESSDAEEGPGAASGQGAARLAWRLPAIPQIRRGPQGGGASARASAVAAREAGHGRGLAAARAGGPSVSIMPDLFASLFSKMDKAPRGRVIDQLEQGHPVWDACARADATTQCVAALKSCQADPDCAKHIVAPAQGGAPGPGRDSVYVLDGGGVVHDDGGPANEKDMWCPFFCLADPRSATCAACGGAAANINRGSGNSAIKNRVSDMFGLSEKSGSGSSFGDRNTPTIGDSTGGVSRDKTTGGGTGGKPKGKP